MRLGQQSGLCLSSPALPGYLQIKSPAIKKKADKTSLPPPNDLKELN